MRKIRSRDRVTAGYRCARLAGKKLALRGEAAVLDKLLFPWSIWHIANEFPMVGLGKYQGWLIT